MKKIIMAAAGILFVVTAMAAPVSTGIASAEVISHATTIPSASKQSATCNEPASASAIVSVGSPDVIASGEWDKQAAKLTFGVSAAPSFGLSLAFSGTVTCNATLPTEKFPIGETGLILVITPKMSFVATGKVDADFTWHPSIHVGFTVGGNGFIEGLHSYVNGTGVVFRGSGTVTMGLNLQSVIETAGGAVGVEGDFGPTIVGQVKGTTGTGVVCWKGSASANARFGTFVNAFGFKKKFTGQEWNLGSVQLSSSECSLASSYSTTYDNLTYGVTSTGSLTDMSVNATGALTGMLTVNPPLYGTSSLSGTLTGNSIKFMTGAGADFTGTVSEPSGDMSGTYVFPSDGQHGTWKATPEAVAA